MKIDFNSWHARLYRLHHRMKYGWEPNSYYGTNLCPYMRTVLFYWWLRWLFIDGKIKIGKRIPVPAILAAFVFFFGPGLAGIISYVFKCLLIGLDSIVVIVALVVGFVTLFVVVKKKVANSKFHDAVLEPVADATGSFIQLLGEYTQSFHNKICPHIDFVDDGESKSDSFSVHVAPDYDVEPKEDDDSKGENSADLGCG